MIYHKISELPADYEVYVKILTRGGIGKYPTVRIKKGDKVIAVRNGRYVRYLKVIRFSYDGFTFEMPYTM
jgi:hypothetical protein